MSYNKIGVYLPGCLHHRQADFCAEIYLGTLQQVSVGISLSLPCFFPQGKHFQPGAHDSDNQIIKLLYSY